MPVAKPPRYQNVFLLDFSSFSETEKSYSKPSLVNTKGVEQQTIPKGSNSASSGIIMPKTDTNRQIKVLVGSMSKRNKFPMNKSTNIKKTTTIAFTIEITYFPFCGLGQLRIFYFIFACFPVITAFITRNDFRKKKLNQFKSLLSSPGSKLTYCFFVLVEKAWNIFIGNLSHMQILTQNPPA